MTLKEKVNKFEFMDKVYVLNGELIYEGYYVGYCGDLDTFSILFDYDTREYDVSQYKIQDVFDAKEDALKEIAIRRIKTYEDKINAIKKEYNL